MGSQFVIGSDVSNSALALILQGSLGVVCPKNSTINGVDRLVGQATLLVASRELLGRYAREIGEQRPQTVAEDPATSKFLTFLYPDYSKPVSNDEERRAKIAEIHRFSGNLTTKDIIEKLGRFARPVETAPVSQRSACISMA